MKVSIKTKFLAISLIALMCVSALFYGGYNLSKLMKETRFEIENAYSASLLHAKLYGAHEFIGLSTRLYYAYASSGNRDLFQNSLSEYNEHTKDFNEALDSLLNLKLSESLHKELLEIKEMSAEELLKSNMLINNPSPSAEDFSSLKASFLKLDKPLHTLSDDILKFIEEMKNSADLIVKTAKQRFLTISCISLLFIFFMPAFTSKNILDPQAEITGIMYKILSGEYNVTIPFLDRTDEIGEIAKALEKFRVNTINIKEAEEKAKKEKKKSEEERNNQLIEISNSFEQTVKTITDIVASSTTEMDTTARELDYISTQNQQDAKQLSSLSLQASSNIRDVAKAIGEFTVAINEINKQVSNSSTYAGKATILSDNISSMINELADKANSITSIIDIINNITSQIDLLALNATIEAARAGESGKGFAVVANEVKALATQTSKATEQINVQISAIQQSTEKVVVGMREITDSVKTINQTSASIASAVEEQNVTASYIANNIEKVAEMSNGVNNGTTKVLSSLEKSSTSSSQMVVSAEDLLKQVSMLQTEVNKFLSGLKVS